jgi:hypothetical protein
VLATSELLAFDRRPSESLEILPQFPITLGGKTVLVNLLVVPGLLDFDMLLGSDRVYAMNVMVYMLFRVMHFHRNRSIVTIDHFSYDNHHPSSISTQCSPLYVPIVQVDSSLPRVNYVMPYPQCSIAYEKGSLQSCFPSQDRVSTIDHVVYPMGKGDLLLSPFVPSDLDFSLESDITICKTSSPGICVMSSLGFMDVEFPSDEAILEALITDFRPLPELETLQVGYQRNPWPEPRNGL